MQPFDAEICFWWSRYQLDITIEFLLKLWPVYVMELPHNGTDESEMRSEGFDLDSTDRVLC